MKQPLKVVIYGDTLVLGCLRASLASYEGLELDSIGAHAASAQELTGLQPDIILFDLAAGEPAFQYSIAARSPGLLLVGVDSETNRVMAWHGEELCRLSTAELVQAIAGAREDMERAPAGATRGAGP